MVDHEIRSLDGVIRRVKLSPIKAIRAHCLECMGWNYDEVRNCTDPICPLYPFREGKNLREKKGFSDEERILVGERFKRTRRR